MEAERRADLSARRVAVESAASQAKHALARSSVPSDEAASAHASPLGAAQDQHRPGATAAMPVQDDASEPESFLPDADPAASPSDQYREHLRVRAKELKCAQRSCLPAFSL